MQEEEEKFDINNPVVVQKFLNDWEELKKEYGSAISKNILKTRIAKRLVRN